MEVHVGECRLDASIVDQAEGAQLVLGSLKDQMVRTEIESAHTSKPEDVLAHRILESELTANTLQHLFIYFLYY